MVHDWSTLVQCILFDTPVRPLYEYPMTHIIICLALLSAACSLHAWCKGSNLLAAVMFLISWTACACSTAYAFQGLSAATLAWFLAPPYAVLVLWALEPMQARLEAHRDAIVPLEPLVHPAPDADWEIHDDWSETTVWVDEDEVPTVRRKYSSMFPKVG